RGGGFGGGGPAPAKKGALLIVPRGPLRGIDDAVMVRVHLIEPLAEAAVALGVAEPGKPVVIRLCLVEPGALARLQVGSRQLGGELRLPAFDKAQAPFAVLVEGDLVLTCRGERGGAFGNYGVDCTS